jgi:opacity protein-like surface antigen
LKHLILIVLLSISISAASAQDVSPVTFGPRFAVNFLDPSYTSSTGLKIEGKTGYSAGIFVRADIGLFTIQPELAYVVHKGKGTDGSGSAIEFETQSFDVPLLFGVKFVDAEAVKLRVLAGPVFSFNTSRSATGSEIFNRAPDYVTAWQAGLALDVWKFIFDVRYEGSFKNQLTDQVGNNAKLNAIQIGASFKIL